MHNLHVAQLKTLFNISNSQIWILFIQQQVKKRKISPATGILFEITKCRNEIQVAQQLHKGM